MDAISVVLRCKRRLNLTELVLRRFLELIDVPFEIVVAYDGNDLDYLDRLIQIYDFEYIVTNPDGKRSRFDLLNEALDFCTKQFFMYLENDFYQMKSGAIESAIEALEKHPHLDLVRFEFLPYEEWQVERKEKLSQDILFLMKKDVRLNTNFTPHLRREKFPFGRFPKEKIVGILPELVFTDLWMKNKKRFACLQEDYFRHIGIYDQGGYYRQNYTERFTGIRGQKQVAPLKEFNTICENKYYRELYKKYINSQRTEKLVILAFDGMDYFIIKEKYPPLLQLAYGRTSLENHIKAGGESGGATNEVFATFITGQTMNVHGVKIPFDYGLSLKGKIKTIFELTNSVAIDVPIYNTHPDMTRFHRRCNWTHGSESFRKQMKMMEEEYRRKVSIERDRLERDLYDYLYTLKFDRIKQAISEKKQLTMIYFWFTDLIGHMGEPNRLERMYENVVNVVKMIKAQIGDSLLLIMSDHGMHRGDHRPNGAFWSLSKNIMQTNYVPEMEEWYNIIERWIT